LHYSSDIHSLVKEFSDVPKEFQDKLPPIYDTQSEIESDYEEFIYHPDIDSNEDVDDFINDNVDEELGDDIVESSTLISPRSHPSGYGDYLCLS